MRERRKSVEPPGEDLAPASEPRQLALLSVVLDQPSVNGTGESSQMGLRRFVHDRENQELKELGGRVRFARQHDVAVRVRETTQCFGSAVHGEVVQIVRTETAMVEWSKSRAYS